MKRSWLALESRTMIKNVLSLPFSVKRVVPISVSFALESHSCASTFNAAVGGWPSDTSTVLNSHADFQNVECYAWK